MSNLERIKEAKAALFKDVPKGSYFFHADCGLMRKLVVPILKGAFFMEAMHLGNGPVFTPCCIHDSTIVVQVDANLNETI
jgi:hypothetical protein